MTITATKPTTFTYREISLQDRLREVAREVGIKPALLFGDRVVTYAELDAATDRLAAPLAQRGLKKGARLPPLMPNSGGFFFAFYGTLKAGRLGKPIHAP